MPEHIRVGRMHRPLPGLLTVNVEGHEHTKATELFRRIEELRPRSAGDRSNLATALVFIGDPSAAEGELKACLDVDPGFWKAYPGPVATAHACRCDRAMDNYEPQLRLLRRLLESAGISITG